jgi:hypothetical protein
MNWAGDGLLGGGLFFDLLGLNCYKKPNLANLFTLTNVSWVVKLI